jgi:hypothetical protein
MHVSAALLALLAAVPASFAQEHHAHGPGIPESLRHEHQEIQHALQEAVNAPREVGAAARDLQRVLIPHFQREEQIALPPLGVLQRLLQQQDVASLKSWLLPMTDSLRAELPRMLEEHVVISQAVRRLEEAGQAAGNQHAVDFAQALARHARAEEEMFYPMAILVGEIVRGRRQ